MARMDEEAYFYIAGRFKDMIISGGENIYAAEVEAVFRQHDCVQDAALIGSAGQDMGGSWLDDRGTQTELFGNFGRAAAVLSGTSGKVQAPETDRIC